MLLITFRSGFSIAFGTELKPSVLATKYYPQLTAVSIQIGKINSIRCDEETHMPVKYRGYMLPDALFKADEARPAKVAAASFNSINALNPNEAAFTSAVRPSQTQSPRPLILTPEFIREHVDKKSLEVVLLGLTTLGFPCYFPSVDEDGNDTVTQFDAAHENFFDHLDNLRAFKDEDYFLFAEKFSLARDELCVLTRDVTTQFANLQTPLATWYTISDSTTVIPAQEVVNNYPFRFQFNLDLAKSYNWLRVLDHLRGHPDEADIIFEDIENADIPEERLGNYLGRLKGHPEKQKYILIKNVNNIEDVSYLELALIGLEGEPELQQALLREKEELITCFVSFRDCVYNVSKSPLVQTWLVRKFQNKYINAKTFSFLLDCLRQNHSLQDELLEKYQDEIATCKQFVNCLAALRDRPQKQEIIFLKLFPRFNAAKNIATILNSLAGNYTLQDELLRAHHDTIKGQSKLKLALEALSGRDALQAKFFKRLIGENIPESFFYEFLKVLKGNTSLQARFLAHFGKNITSQKHLKRCLSALRGVPILQQELLDIHPDLITNGNELNMILGVLDNQPLMQKRLYLKHQHKIRSVGLLWSCLLAFKERPKTLEQLLMLSPLRYELFTFEKFVRLISLFTADETRVYRHISSESGKANLVGQYQLRDILPEYPASTRTAPQKFWHQLHSRENYAPENIVKLTITTTESEHFKTLLQQIKANRFKNLAAVKLLGGERENIRKLFLALSTHCRKTLIRVEVSADIYPFILCQNVSYQSCPSKLEISQSLLKTVVPHQNEQIQALAHISRPPIQATRLYISTSTRVGQFAAGTIHNTFNMLEAGELLNPSSNPLQRVRTVVVTSRLPNSLEQHEYTPDIYAEYKLSSLTMIDIRKLRDETNPKSRQHYLFKQNLHQGFNRLLSIRTDDEFRGMLGQLPKDAKLFKGDDDFYYLEVSAPCTVQYVISAKTKPQPRSRLSKKVQQIIRLYQNKAGIHSPTSLPILSNFDSIKAWLVALYHYGPREDVPCRHRVEVIAYQLKKNNIKHRICRVDNNHRVIEIQTNDGSYLSVDLGGMPATLEYQSMTEVYSHGQHNKQEDVAEEEKSQAEPIIAKSVDSPLATVVRTLLVNLDKQYLITSKVELSRALKKYHKLLITHPSPEALTELLLRENNGIHTLVLDSPKQLQHLLGRLHIAKTGKVTLSSGESELLTFILHAKENPARHQLIIHWDKFSATEKVALNTILDTPASVCGTSLPDNIDIVSLCQKETNDSSFKSRHSCNIKTSLTLNINKLKFHKDDNTIEIDVQGRDDWQAVLLGRILLKRGELVFIPGPLLNYLQDNHYEHVVIKNLPREHRAACRTFLARCRAKGSLHYHGLTIKVPYEISFEIDTDDFDFTHVTTKLHRVRYNVVNNPNGMMIINSQWLNLLFQRDSFTKDGYHQSNGLIAEYGGKELSLWCTSQLSHAEWYAIFTEAKRHMTRLILHLAPGVELPNSVKLQEVSIEADDENEHKEEDAVLPQVFYTEDAFSHAPAQDNALTIYLEDESVSTLFSRPQHRFVQGKIVFDESKLTAFERALLLGQKVILRGKISSDLLQLLHPILMGHYWPNRKQHCQPGKNLTVLLEGVTPTIEAQLNCLGDRAQKINSRDGADSVIVYDEESKREDDKITYDDFMRARTNALSKALHSHNVVQLRGPTGVGKSSLMQAISHDEKHRIFFGLSQLEAWSKANTNDSDAILFIDEANLTDQHLTAFEAIKAGKDTILHYQGKTYPVSGKHKVVLAENDHSYGGGRHQQRVVESGNTAILQLSDFPRAILYEHMLAPLLNTEVFNIDEVTYKKICEGFIDNYYQQRQSAKNDRACPCVRDLQQWAIDVLMLSLNEIDEVSSDVPMHVNLPSQEATCQELMRFIQAHQLQKTVLKSHIGLGLNGFYLKGPPGVGKSMLVHKCLTARGLVERTDDHANNHPCFVKIDASLSFEKITAQIIGAFERGDAIWIDEINSISNSGIERVLNDVLTGIHPITKKPSQNPGFLAIFTGNSAGLSGRRVLSPALIHRSRCEDMPNLQFDDILEIVSTKLADVTREDAVTIAHAAYDTMRSNPGINLRTLERCLPLIARHVAQNRPDQKPVANLVVRRQMTRRVAKAPQKTITARRRALAKRCVIC